MVMVVMVLVVVGVVCVTREPKDAKTMTEFGRIPSQWLLVHYIFQREGS